MEPYSPTRNLIVESIELKVIAVTDSSAEYIEDLTKGLVISLGLLKTKLSRQCSFNAGGLPIVLLHVYLFCSS